MAELLFDFDNPSDAARSLKRVAQAMLRAGQPVVSSDFDQKVRRSSAVSYRQALLTLASGQTVTLMIKLTGDVFRVLLNGAVLPIKNQDGLKAIAEIAASAERGQAKFQAAQARKKVELPKGIRTAAPKMEQVLQQRNGELDAQIAERTAQRDALKAELGETALDAVGELGDAAMDSAALDEAIALAVRIVGGEMLDSTDLSGAISTLRIALDTVEINRPINVEAGNLDQAELEAQNAASFRKAISILEGQSLDAVEGQPKGFPKRWHDGRLYNRDQFELVPTDEHGEMPPGWVLKPGAVPVLNDAGADGLSGAALEVLEQLADGPVEDGDVISKSARDELVDAGLIDRYTDAGDNAINDAGLDHLATLGAPSEDQASLFDEAGMHEGQELA